MTSSSDNKVVLTGIRVSGEIHLGNYLGAMKPAVDRTLQNNMESYLFVADLHGLTTAPPGDELRQNTRSIAAAWLATGVDPSKTVLWKQSDVPEVLELSYLLSCVTSLGLLERAHSYKDAQAKNKVVKAGLLFYPVLMAADILLYEADLVPVGRDQAQHLEMTRDIATFFNETYMPLLKLPEAIVSKGAGIVPGTDGRKMSKSYHNGIDLFAPEKTLKKQVMGVKTDSKTLEEPKAPEECLVYQIFSLIADPATSEEMAKRLRGGNYGYGDAKKMLLSYLLDHFGTMRKDFDRLMDDRTALDAQLQLGAEKARSKAQPMIQRLKEIVGL